MTATNYPECLAFTLRYEGGYVNNPRDPGGPTNMGITQATLSHELGRRATILDVRNLSKETAARIYQKKYWNLVDGDHLESGVDLLAFDIAVNSGPGRATAWLAACAHLSGVPRIKWLDQRRRSFWRSLRTWRFFGRGWSAREDACLRLAFILASRKAAS